MCELHHEFLSYDQAHEACQHAWDMRIRGGPFDKQLHVIGGICMQAYEQRMVHDVILSEKISIWGWVSTPAPAKATTVAEVYESATKQGVLQEAIDLGLEPKYLLKVQQRELRIKMCYPLVDEN